MTVVSGLRAELGVPARQRLAMFMLLGAKKTLVPRAAAAANALLFHEVDTQEFGATAAPQEFGATASPTDAPHFEIAIDGAPVQLGKCYDGQTGERPMTFEVTGNEGHVVVWDKSTSALCEEAGVSGGLYIHFAGSGAALPMTAGAGEDIHSYEAAYFETLPVNGTVCQPFSGEGSLRDAPHRSWSVARGGTWCPPAAAWERSARQTRQLLFADPVGEMGVQAPPAPPVRSAAPTRAVSWWYAPSSYGGADINDTLAVLAQHKAATSLMLYCGHGVDNEGRLTLDSSSLVLCEGMLPRLRALNIKAEFVLNDGCTNVTAHKRFFANASAVVPQLVAIGRRYGIDGWNLDLEPQTVPGTAADATVYAQFCTGLKAALNAQEMRLTVDVAQWSPMLSQFGVLAPSVDRLMDMETYHAASMGGWLHGDNYGGYYDSFVNERVPRPTAGVGIGSWPAKCGDAPCWSATEESVAPRLARMANDSVPEIAMFRICRPLAPLDERYPQEWWWEPLARWLHAAPSAAAP